MKLQLPNVPEPASPGTHVAVVCDVQDLGLTQTKWGEKHRMRIAFMVAQRDSGGKNKVCSLFCNASIHRQSTLAGMVKNITGQYPRNNWDTETLVGLDCMITTELSEDGAYSNVTSVKPLPPKTPTVIIPLDYTRAKDRPTKSNWKANGKGKVTKSTHNVEVLDADVQFPGLPE